MKTVLLLNHAPNPRMLKRVSLMMEFGEVHVVCLDRTDVNIWEIDSSLYTSIEAVKMAVPSSKHLVKRYIATRKFRKIAKRKIYSIEPDLIYTELFDCLLIAAEAKRQIPGCSMVYEVADIREALLSDETSLLRKLKQSVIKAIEKRAFSAVDRLVVTSGRFYEDYYSSLMPFDRTIFAPNAPDSSLFEGYCANVNRGRFCLGFVGSIRYLDQLKLMVDACHITGVSCLIAGAAVSDAADKEIREYSQGKDVSFTGRFNYAQQVREIYSQIDCVFAVYDADNPNVRIALPNKLYESVFCGLPILVAKGTYLSELVEEWGVGLSVDHKNLEDLVGAIQRLRDDKNLRLSIQDNCKRVLLDESWLDWRKDLSDFCHQIEFNASK
ncbi:MAG: glycosyltransferase [Coriobacteriia bacterium]|nr:glycosyltransferase [Coriobacteriia bacterium]